MTATFAKSSRSRLGAGVSTSSGDSSSLVSRARCLRSKNASPFETPQTVIASKTRTAITMTIPNALTYSPSYTDVQSNAVYLDPKS